MPACCGRGSKKAKALVKTNGPVVFASEKPAIQGRCSVCGSAGGYAKKFSNGVRIRVFICTENAHILKV